MEFVISMNAIEPQFKNCYVIEISWMFGDADYFDVTEVKFDNNKQDSMSNFIMTLEKMLKYWPQGRSGHCTFKEEILPDLAKFDELLYRPMFGDWNDANPDSYRIYFYDQNGLKYPITVKMNNNDVQNINDFALMRRMKQCLDLDRIDMNK